MRNCELRMSNVTFRNMNCECSTSSQVRSSPQYGKQDTREPPEAGGARSAQSPFDPLPQQGIKWLGGAINE